MKKALFYGLGIPAIYFGVALALANLFGKEASNTSILITFICPLIVTFIVALITEVISEDLASEDVKPSVYSRYFSFVDSASDVIEKKVVPLLNGTRDRSWVNWNEIPGLKNIPNEGFALDVLGRILYKVLMWHYASPYILCHTGISYFAEEGFEIRRFD